MEKKISIWKILFTIVMLLSIIAGSTYAYFSWESSSEQRTNVVFSVPNICSISVDGGGVIDSSNVSVVPSSCTNTKNAIIKEIKIDTDIKYPEQVVYLDLWLDINSLASELSASNNFKYALTDSPTSCVNGEMYSGTFNGLSVGNKVRIFKKSYSGTSPVTYSETYYLYIWLDAAETSVETAGKSFELSLNGTCGNFVDETAPVVQMTSTNNVSDTQTVTLDVSDNNEIKAYYFGTSDPEIEDVSWTIVNTTEDISESVLVSESGTYYLAAEDDSDNRTVISEDFYETNLSVTNGSVPYRRIITMNGNTITLPEATPITDYSFKGWYTTCPRGQRISPG